MNLCSDNGRQLNAFYEKELQDIVGPLIGHSSDGDSRRRKLMLQLGTNKVGSRYRAIPMELGFVLSCRKIETENGYIIRDACDQDYITRSFLIHLTMLRVY